MVLLRGFPVLAGVADWYSLLPRCWWPRCLLVVVLLVCRLVGVLLCRVLGSGWFVSGAGVLGAASWSGLWVLGRGRGYVLSFG